MPSTGGAQLLHVDSRDITECTRWAAAELGARSAGARAVLLLLLLLLLLSCLLPVLLRQWLWLVP
jgi:hypothetical protein